MFAIEDKLIKSTFTPFKILRHCPFNHSAVFLSWIFCYFYPGHSHPLHICIPSKKLLMVGFCSSPADHFFPSHNQITHWPFLYHQENYLHFFTTHFPIEFFAFLYPQENSLHFFTTLTRGISLLFSEELYASICHYILA